jgi:hypothetical protein
MALTNQWLMNEPSGTTLVDSVGGNTATISTGTNAVVQGPGRFLHRDATDFSGTPRYNLGSDIPLTAASDWSVSVWYLATSQGTGKIVGSISGSAAIRELNPTQLRVTNDAGTSEDFTMPWALSQSIWHHLLVTNDGGTMRLWLDGNLATETNTWTGTITLQAIGRGNSANHDGGISNLQIYNNDETANWLTHWTGSGRSDLLGSLLYYQNTPAILREKTYCFLSTSQMNGTANMISGINEWIDDVNIRKIHADIEPTTSFAGGPDESFIPSQWFNDKYTFYPYWPTLTTPQKVDFSRMCLVWMCKQITELKTSIIPGNFPQFRGLPIGQYIAWSNYAPSALGGSTACLDDMVADGCSNAAEGYVDDFAAPAPAAGDYPGLFQILDEISIPLYRSPAVTLASYALNMYPQLDDLLSAWAGRGRAVALVAPVFVAGETLTSWIDGDEWLYSIRLAKSLGCDDAVCLQFHEDGYPGTIETNPSWQDTGYTTATGDGNEISAAAYKFAGSRRPGRAVPIRSALGGLI